MLEFPLRPLAHYYAQKHAARFRFSPRHQRWLRLDELSGVWRPDDARERLEAARELVNEAARAAQNANITSRGNAEALLRLAAETEPLMTANISDEEIGPGLQRLSGGRG